ncbi:CLUMA_CG003173, isoform A [Clunio marinus]|uniref:CLUMA_CG003173, isoform A n=1 Tax=Clunio marinus TaxID=568069 RepID=A0A1J1HMZ0_9DIPT|nr:CLUMA_CG003173, isoform A [Clunio marinus]
MEKRDDAIYDVHNLECELCRFGKLMNHLLVHVDWMIKNAIQFKKYGSEMLVCNDILSTNECKLYDTI